MANATFPQIAQCITAMSNPDFVGKAYAEYLDDCANNYEQVMNAVSIAISDIPDEEETAEEAMSRVEATLASLGINPNANFNTDFGSLPLGQYITSLSMQAQKDCNLDASALTADAIELISGSDGVSRVKASYSDLMQSMKDTYTSCRLAACASLASIQTDVAGRLSDFSARVNTKLGSLTKAGADVASYYSGMLSQSTATTASIAASISESMGTITQSLDGESTDASNCDIYSYTGASPKAALDYSTAVKAIGSTAKVIAKGVAATVGAVFNSIVKPVFNKVVKAVKGVYDPYDLEVRDEKSDNLRVDGWCIEYDISYLASRKVQGAVSNNYIMPDGPKTFRNASALKNGWYQLSLFFGDVYVKIDTQSDASTVKFFPNVLDYSAMGELNSIPLVTTSTNFSDTYVAYIRQDWALSYLQALAEDGRKVWNLGLNPVDVSTMPESLALLNLSISVELFKRFLASIYYIVTASSQLDEQGRYPYIQPTVASVGKHAEFADSPAGTFTDNTSNKYWIQVASGWSVDSNGQAVNRTKQMLSTNQYCGSAYDGSTVPDLPDDFLVCLAGLIALQAYDRSVNPTNYTFIPFLQNTTVEAPGRFRIKTDKENQDALTKFVSVVVAVVAVVAVGVAAGVVAKKVARAKLWKARSSAGQLDNKMWQGEQLTAKERRQYNRAQRRLQNASASSPFNSVAETVQSTMSSSSSNSLNSITTLIAGEPLSV